LLYRATNNFPEPFGKPDMRNDSLANLCIIKLKKRISDHLITGGNGKVVGASGQMDELQVI